MLKIRALYLALLPELIGCTTTQSSESKSVKFITDYAGHNCTFIEEISAFDPFSSTMKKEKRSSLYELMNKAAAIRGNALLAGEHETSLAGTEIKGLVLQCKFKGDNQMATV